MFWSNDSFIHFIHKFLKYHTSIKLSTKESYIECILNNNLQIDSKRVLLKLTRKCDALDCPITVCQHSERLLNLSLQLLLTAFPCP